jgi:acetate---CoA ligase (ADP-forming)
VPHAIPGLKQSVTALGALTWWSQATGPSAPTPSLAEPVAVPSTDGPWSELDARQALSAAGVPVVPATLARSADEAVLAARHYAAPVAMKIASPDILHKSDIGAVLLNVTGDDAVREAYDRITAAVEMKAADASIEGILLSPMRSGGVEMLVGVTRDPQWGLIMAVAVGGIFVEILDDAALATLPVTPEQAGRLVNQLRAAALLRGARGTAAADLTALARVIARIGDLALALGDRLESLEVNPLRVDGGDIEALDALVTWTPSR